jgi:murein L,D-transpeptidase YafK
MKIMCRILIAPLLLFYLCNSVGASTGNGKALDLIPDVLVSFDPDDVTEYAIVVEKESQQLFVYSFDKVFREVHRFKCSTGKTDGPKLVSGDSRTPEGIYYSDREFEKKDLSAIYGSRAFPVDYPNILDRMAGKTGNSIWLHGTDKPKKPKDTNGCVVLADQDIDTLAKYIRFNRTPVIIAEKLNFVPVVSVKRTGESINEFLSGWFDSIRNGTYQEYVKFYDYDYVPDITWWSEWNAERKKYYSDKKSFSVIPKWVSVVGYNGIYSVLFEQVAKTGDKESFAGIRKIFLSNRDGEFRIIGEEYLPADKDRKSGEDKNPLIAAFGNLNDFSGRKQQQRDDLKNRRGQEKPPVKDQVIADAINGWVKAWSSRDAGLYGSYYAKDFRSQGMNRDAWLQHKEQIFRKYDYINVSIEKLSIKPGSRASHAKFIQIYKSSGLNNAGLKELVLKLEEGKWKIFRESWKKR